MPGREQVQVVGLVLDSPHSLKSQSRIRKPIGGGILITGNVTKKAKGGEGHHRQQGIMHLLFTSGTDGHLYDCPP